MDLNSKNLSQDITLDELRTVYGNMRASTVPKKTALTIKAILKSDWALDCFIAMALPKDDKLLKELIHDFKYEKQWGEIFKIQSNRVQFEPSLEWEEAFLSSTPLICEDKRHKNSYLVPVGALGYRLLVTFRDGIVTADLYHNTANFMNNLFIYEAVFESLRMELKSRNPLVPKLVKGGNVAYTLSKSSLTMGNIHFLSADLAKVVAKRCELAWEKIYGTDIPRIKEIFKIEEERISNWTCTWSVYFTNAVSNEVKCEAVIRLNGKVFEMEIK